MHSTTPWHYSLAFESPFSDCQRAPLECRFLISVIAAEDFNCQTSLPLSPLSFSLSLSFRVFSFWLTISLFRLVSFVLLPSLFKMSMSFRSFLSYFFLFYSVFLVFPYLVSFLDEVSTRSYDSCWLFAYRVPQSLVSCLPALADSSRTEGFEIDKLSTYLCVGCTPNLTWKSRICNDVLDF